MHQSDTTGMTENIKVLKTQIENKIQYVKEKTFNNQLMKYEANNDSIDRRLLGQLITENSVILNLVYLHAL